MRIVGLAGVVLALAVVACTAPSGTQEGAEAINVNAILAARDFAVGENRFPFALIGMDGEPLMNARIRATFHSLHEDGSSTRKSQADAEFRSVVSNLPHLHEDGGLHLHQHVQGVYVVDGLVLDEPGIWQALLEIDRDGETVAATANLAFQVAAEFATFRPGDPAPATWNPTSRDAGDLSDITPHQPPVPGLYELTVAEALEQAKPFVVSFSTPAFCVSRACGPVTDVIAALHGLHKDSVNFIHIEPWDLRTARTEGRLVLVDAAKAWNLPSEPWVFIVDANGRIAAAFEGLVSAEELTVVLDSLEP